MPESEDLRMSFTEHYAELVARFFRITFAILSVFFVTVFLWKVAASFFYLFTSVIGGSSLNSIKDTPFNRWLWAAFFASLVGFSRFVSHMMLFIEPGLYADERRVLNVTRRWLYISLVIAVILPGLIVRLSNHSSLVTSIALALDLKGIVIRFLLSAVLTACFLNIPRSRLPLKTGFFLIIIPLIWLAPDHFIFTVVAGIIELSAIVFIVSYTILFNLNARARNDEQSNSSLL